VGTLPNLRYIPITKPLTGMGSAKGISIGVAPSGASNASIHGGHHSVVAIGASIPGNLMALAVSLALAAVIAVVVFSLLRRESSFSQALYEPLDKTALIDECSTSYRYSDEAELLHRALLALRNRIRCYACTPLEIRSRIESCTLNAFVEAYHLVVYGGSKLRIDKALREVEKCLERSWRSQ